MVLGQEINKCILCPQKYTCGTYMSQIVNGINNAQINNINKTDSQSINRPINKSNEDNVINVQEITALLSSITDTFNKTSQELISENTLLKEEMEKIKVELGELKQSKETFLEPEVEIVNTEILKDDQSQVENGLELYNNKNDTTVFREKKTIFGTKKWVEEKK